MWFSASAFSIACDRSLTLLTLCNKTKKERIVAKQEEVNALQQQISLTKAREINLPSKIASISAARIFEQAFFLNNVLRIRGANSMSEAWAAGEGNKCSSF